MQIFSIDYLGVSLKRDRLVFGSINVKTIHTKEEKRKILKTTVTQINFYFSLI